VVTVPVVVPPDFELWTVIRIEADAIGAESVERSTVTAPDIV
jgi:hypothetical protein